MTSAGVSIPQYSTEVTGMSGIAEAWVALSPTAQALFQGFALMLLLQAYKWLEKRIGWLPSLKDAEPRLKQGIVALCALLAACIEAPADAQFIDMLSAWIATTLGAIGGHQGLMHFINRPLERKRNG